MLIATEKPVVDTVPVDAGRVSVPDAVALACITVEPLEEPLNCKPPVDGTRRRSVLLVVNAMTFAAGYKTPAVLLVVPANAGTLALPSGVEIPVVPLMTTAIVMLRVEDQQEPKTALLHPRNRPCHLLDKEQALPNQQSRDLTPKMDKASAE